MILVQLATFPNQKAETLNNGLKAVMLEGALPRKDSGQVIAPSGHSFPGFVGPTLNPTNDFCVSLQDHLRQSACIRTF